MDRYRAHASGQFLLKQSNMVENQIQKYRTVIELSCQPTFRRNGKQPVDSGSGGASRTRSGVLALFWPK